METQDASIAVLVAGDFSSAEPEPKVRSEESGGGGGHRQVWNPLPQLCPRFLLHLHPSPQAPGLKGAKVRDRESVLPSC